MFKAFLEQTYTCGKLIRLEMGGSEELTAEQFSRLTAEQEDYGIH